MYALSRVIKMCLLLLIVTIPWYVADSMLWKKFLLMNGANIGQKMLLYLKQSMFDLLLFNSGRCASECCIQITASINKPYFGDGNTIVQLLMCITCWKWYFLELWLYQITIMKLHAGVVTVAIWSLEVARMSLKA